MANSTLQTTQLWATIRNARHIADRLYNREVPDGGLEPEVAVFLDDESMSHLVLATLNGSEIESPAIWLNGLPAALAQIGAPIQHYHIQAVSSTLCGSPDHTYGRQPDIPFLLHSWLQTEFLKSSASSPIAGLALLAGERYGPSSGIKYDPWFYLNEQSTASWGSTCTVLGRYANDAALGKASLVLADHRTHRVIFSSAPSLPPAALRAFAADAGVHLYLEPNATDGVEALGAGVLLRGGVAAAAARKVSLPARTGGWNVVDEEGDTVCSSCRSFAARLNPGDVKIWLLQPSSQVDAAEGPLREFFSV